MEHKSSESNVFIDKYLTPLAIILAAVIIAGVFVFGKGAPAAPATGTGSGTAVDIKNVSTDGDPYIGDANAPTTVALFYDYQCPFCKQFELTVTPQLLEKYVKTGKTKIVFKDFQFLGNDSDTAALYGRAVWAAAPDHFYEWYVAMFTAQDEEGDKGFGNLATIEKLTATIAGIDTAKVAQLMKDNKAAYTAAYQKDRAEGAALGINGTPSIIVGQKLFTGESPAQFFTDISAVLDAELAGK
jgi:protein-disulfide isomerase